MKEYKALKTKFIIRIFLKKSSIFRLNSVYKIKMNISKKIKNYYRQNKKKCYNNYSYV